MDPILVYHATWFINFFIKALNLVSVFNYSLSTKLPLFLIYWSSLTLGLWSGSYIFKIRSKKKDKDVIYKIGYGELAYSRKKIFSLLGIMLMIDVISIILAFSIILSGYSLRNLFIAREYHGMARDYKQIMYITILGAFQMLLSTKLMYLIKNSKYLIIVFIVASFPQLIITAFTSGRTTFLTFLLLFWILWYNINNKTSFNKSSLITTLVLILLIVAIFTVIDTGRRTMKISLPDRDSFLRMLEYIQGPFEAFEFFNTLSIYDEMKGYPGYYTFYFFFNQLNDVGVNYGPNVNAHDLYYIGMQYDPKLAQFPGTVFISIHFDYGTYGGILFTFIWGFSIMYILKKRFKKYNLFWEIFLALNIFQLLWSGQMYYLFGSSSHMFLLIMAFIREIIRAMLRVLYKVKNENKIKRIQFST